MPYHKDKGIYNQFGNQNEINRTQARSSGRGTDRVMPGVLFGRMCHNGHNKLHRPFSDIGGLKHE